MSDSRSEPSPAEMAELNRLLSDDAVWAEPSPDVEDRVLAAIAEAQSEMQSTGGLLALEPDTDDQARSTDQPPFQTPPGQPTEQTGRQDGVIDLGEHRRRRDRRLWPLTVAAALLIAAVSGTIGYQLRQANSATEVAESDEFTVAMGPTESAPGASAVARINERGNGAQIILEIEGLEPAPEGFFYEVWLVRPDPRNPISAGSFHMRGADIGEIEFWAGVSPQIYSVITVTLESEADRNAPGELILRGDILP